MSVLLMFFIIVVIINKAFKLFKLVLVVYCDSCCHWWYPENSGNQKNVYNAKKPLQTPSTVSTWRFYRDAWWCNSCGQSGQMVKLSLMAEWPNGEVAWEQNGLRRSCSCGFIPIGRHVTSCTSYVLHTSFWLKCWKLRCHDFSALRD